MPNRTYVFAEYPQENEVLPPSMSGGGTVNGELTAAQIAAGATGMAGVTASGRLVTPAGAQLAGAVVYLGATHVGGAGRSKTDADTAIGVLWSLLIPAGTLQANDTIIMRPKLTVPNSATTKTFGVRTQTGAISIYTVSATTSASILPWVDGSMRNSLTSQIWVPSGTTGIASVSGTALLSTSIDFSVDQTLEFYGQWGTAGAGSNSITLESALVYAIRGA